MIRGRVAVSTLGGALLLLVAVLAGCAAGLSHATSAPPGSLPRPDLVFRMDDGAVLPARLWLPPAGTRPAGIILALHGFTDSRDAWELPAPVFADAGYTVIAPDQRGFGGAPGRGIWAGQERMVDDAAELTAQLRARYPGQRLVVLAESMGSAVAICLAARNPHAADAWVLTSPAVWGRDQMPVVLRAALAIGDTMAPGWRLTGQEIPLDIAASDNREALLRLAHDPLSLHGVTIAMLRGLVDLMGSAQLDSARLPANTLFLNGRRDQVVPLSATAAAWARLPPSVRRAFYLGGYHLLLRDHDRALVEADILAWLADPHVWLPSGADINAAAWQSDQAGSGAKPSFLPAGALDDNFAHPVWPY
jgi:alpha-beta hydrolase superfamily lysophospholipase